MRWIRYIIYISSIIFVLSNKGFRSFVHNCLELKDLKEQSIKLDDEIQEAKKEKIRLASGNKEYLEKLARKELNLTKPDEIEFRFNPPSTSVETDGQ